MTKRSTEIQQLKQIVSRLKSEVSVATVALKEKEARLRRLEAERKGLYVAAALKFGAMTGPQTSELVLDTRYMGEGAAGYELNVTDRADRNARIIQVRRVVEEETR